MQADRNSVSINGASALLDVSRRTIYNWIANGKVERIRTAGGSTRIYVDTLWRTLDDTPRSAAPQRPRRSSSTGRRTVAR